MQESLVPAFALENQLAGKEQTLPKLHRFDVTKLAESITPIETNRKFWKWRVRPGGKSPSARAVQKVTVWRSDLSRHSLLDRRKTDALQLRDSRSVNRAFHELVAEQREDPPAQKDGPGVAVPIDAGRAAMIVTGARRRAQDTERREALRAVAQEKHTRRSID